MKLTLKRNKLQAKRTFGELLDGNKRLCFVLEDAVREVPGKPVASWKIHGATAIPAGSYRITLENSPRFGADTLTVNDVPGFVGVRMHAGNSEQDTEGCQLLGLAVDAHGIVGGTSRPAVALVKGIVKQVIDHGETVTMDVVNP